MVALTFPPDQIGSLLRDHRPSAVNPATGMSATEIWRNSIAGQDIQPVDEARVWDVLSHLTRELTEIDPDERLDYLHGANPALSEEHLGQIARITALWLDGAARSRMRELVRRHFHSGRTPGDVLADWLTETETRRLIDLIRDTDIPDPTLAVCYAFCEVHELAHAVFFIHRERTHRKTDFASINQTPEEVEADLRFVNLR